MSTRNQPKHFATGIGVYAPWRTINPRVRAAQTSAAPKRQFEFKIGYWKEGEFIEREPKKVDNRRIRVRGPHGSGWMKPQPLGKIVFDKVKGWQLREAA